MTNRLLLIIVFISICSGQNIESLNTKSPRKAALWSILPGGGQVYNEKYVKAGIIIALESMAIQQSIKNGADYNADGKTRNLNDRNEYAWWALLVHIYGTLDAVVDGHLKPFNDIMEDGSLQSEVEEKEELTDGK